MQILSSISVLNCLVLLAQAATVSNSSDAEETDTGLASTSRIQERRTQSLCQPLSFSFMASDISRESSTPFVAISPDDSYKVTDDGLQLSLKKPEGAITRQDHTNSVVGQGATINSTFTFQYGKVTFGMKAPAVAGSVTAAILISDEHDEIDVELVGGDEHHWQTNVYAPSPKDTQPLWGVFGEIDDVGSSSSITGYHNYTIDWTEDRIIWSIDKHVVRTLTPAQTRINGTEHYPRQACRIQLGIWDASSPEGTSEWAKGPINWDESPSVITATIRSVQIECN